MKLTLVLVLLVLSGCSGSGSSSNGSLIGRSCVGFPLASNDNGYYCSAQCAQKISAPVSQVWTTQGTCPSSFVLGDIRAESTNYQKLPEQNQSFLAALSVSGSSNTKPSDELMRSVISSHTSDQEYQRFLFALYRVESGNEPDCRAATRLDRGKFYSRGCFQISGQYWSDTNMGGTVENLTDPEYSIAVIEAYMERYAPGAIAKNDWERVSRIHNKGPNGATNPESDLHWSRVQGFWNEW